MTATRVGIVPISVDALITDQRGRTFQLRGVPLAGAPWRAYSSVTWVGMMRWEHNGVIGHGSFQENHPMVVESRLRGRRWTDPIPEITA